MENNSNSLAKIAIGINIVLIVAIIILFVKMPSGSSEVTANEADSTSSNIEDDGELKIGYFNADSLSANLLIMADIEQQMANAQTEAENKMKQKQRDLDAWQAKWQNRGMLLPKEEEQYMKEAQQKQQDAMVFEQNVQMELGQKQEMLMFSHIQRISNFSKLFAEQEGYDFILSYQMGQNIFYASPNMDVTQGMIKIMNDDYESTFTDSTEEEVVDQDNAE